MKDKRELLELAALAAGKQGCVVDFADRAVFLEDGKPGSIEWNPTESDGDCAWLEAAVLLDLCWCDALGEVTVIGPQSKRYTERYSDHNNDRQAARRLASTRAAAEVGRGMK